MKRIYAILSCFFFLLLLIYAFIHPWEYDEAWTYLSVQHESFFDLLSYSHFNIANNHILNSLWFKGMQMAGCRNVVFYRLVSLLCFWPYCYFLFRIVTHHSATTRHTGAMRLDPAWRSASAGWLILFFLPPIMIYFVLGRGYGMATACFLGALYHMKVWLDERKGSAYWNALALGALSTLAIVSFLFPFLAILIYMVFRSGEGIFSRKNIITALLLLPLVLYIYYIGKTILLHDKIINGTDHLVVNGMYATFVSALSIYDFVFPWPDLLEKWNLVMVSKVLVIVSFIPVAWLIGRRRQARRFQEFTVLVILTLLLVLAHVLLKTKYPSDRSVIYIFYLLYVPVVVYIVRSQNSFFKIHYFIVLFFGLVNFCSYFYSLTRPHLYDVLEEEPVRPYTILSDWPNQGDEVYNDLYLRNRFTFVYIAKSFESDWPSVDATIRSAVREKKADFLLLQRSTWLRDQALFATGFSVQRLLSSSYKEVYLIRLR